MTKAQEHVPGMRLPLLPGARVSSTDQALLYTQFHSLQECVDRGSLRFDRNIGGYEPFPPFAVQLAEASQRARLTES